MGVKMSSKFTENLAEPFLQFDVKMASAWEIVDFKCEVELLYFTFNAKKRSLTYLFQSFCVIKR